MQFDQGGLAAAVRPEDGDMLATPNTQGNVVERQMANRRAEPIRFCNSSSGEFKIKYERNKGRWLSVARE